MQRLLLWCCLVMFLVTGCGGGSAMRGSSKSAESPGTQAGYAPDSEFGYAEFVGSIHPDDRAQVLAAIQATADTGCDYDIDIICCSHVPMEPNRVTTDEQVFNSVVIE